MICIVTNDRSSNRIQVAFVQYNRRQPKMLVQTELEMLPEDKKGPNEDDVCIMEMSYANSVNINQFDKKKFKRVLHYVINRVGSLENVGKTVLFKILYFIDFNYYETFEEKLTCESYRKLSHGPAPCHFNIAIEELKNEKKIKEYQNNFKGHNKDYFQKKYLSIIKPDISVFSGEELDFINKNLSIYSNFNATQISEYSHKDMPYRATEDNKIIDYELVFYRDELFSVREYDDND